jgi:hypothetical protein
MEIRSVYCDFCLAYYLPIITTATSALRLLADRYAHIMEGQMTLAFEPKAVPAEP